MSSGPITIAVAGPGDITLDTAADLLNDWLGYGPPDKDGFYEESDREVNLILPITDDSIGDGLDVILKWSENADLPFVAVTDEDSSSRKVNRILKDAEEVHKVEDVADKVASLLAEAEGEAFFVALWGESGDALSEHLLDLTSENDIPAKDLTQGLDDLTFAQEGSDEEPEAEPEPEPEEEVKPTKRRRGRRSEKEIEPEEKPLTEEDVKEPEPKNVSKDVLGDNPKAARATARKKAEDSAKKNAREVAQKIRDLDEKDAKKQEATKALPVSDLENRFAYHPATTPERQGQHAHVRVAALQFAQFLDNIMLDGREKSKAIAKVEEAMFWANAGIARQGATGSPVTAEEPTKTEKEAPAPKRGRGRPRKDGTPAQPRTEDDLAVAYIENEDGTLVKRGRGRVPRGTKIVNLTPSEVEKAIEDGRIEADD